MGRATSEAVKLFVSACYLWSERQGFEKEGANETDTIAFGSEVKEGWVSSQDLYRVQNSVDDNSNLKS